MQQLDRLERERQGALEQYEVRSHMWRFTLRLTIVETVLWHQENPSDLFSHLAEGTFHVSGNQTTLIYPQACLFYFLHFFNPSKSWLIKEEAVITVSHISSCSPCWMSCVKISSISFISSRLTSTQHSYDLIPFITSLPLPLSYSGGVQEAWTSSEQDKDLEGQGGQTRGAGASHPAR